MKKVISLILLSIFIGNMALADTTPSQGVIPMPAPKCDWTKIKDNGDGTFTYTKALHLCVGQLVQTNQTQATQIQDLTKAISLKDLAISYSDARATTWMNTSAGLEDRLQKVDKLEKTNDWLYFGLGVVTTIGAGFMAARLLGH